MAEEFMTKKAFAEYRDLMFEGSQIHSALHELGHTTGSLDPAHQGKQARDYLEAEYSPLEEARAELFGMFAMSRLSKDSTIGEQTAISGHYSMLVSMVQGLRFIPEQAHVKARNMMYHFFQMNGGIVEVTEDGKRKFDFNLALLDQLVADLLGQLGNIKAAGAKDKAAALRERLCFTDPLRDEIQERTNKFPLGRGLIFPRLKHSGDRYYAELEYPVTFSEQSKFRAELAHN